MAEAVTADITLTENAAKRVKALMQMEGNPDTMLRVTVGGGGCSGFQYSFALDDAKTDEDVLFEQHGVKLVVDETSLGLLAGSQVDFVEELVGSSFTIRNPNATSTCGCGSSFSI
jgi:iron-sulfur cluster insertion protein